MKRFKTFFFLALMQLPMSGRHRAFFARLAGVDISVKGHYIGRHVCFDSVHPELIHIGKHVHITAGCVFLTHYLDTSKPGVNWTFGPIHIGDNAFVGMNTIITKSVTIGDNAVIGAGSVVTRDIPANQVWAGNPARYIKDRTADA